MINKKYHKLLRDKVYKNNSNFIYDQIANRINDSVDILTLQFNNILELGINSDLIFNFLSNKYPNAIITRADISTIKKSTKYKTLNMDLDKWKIKNEQYDLICSNFFANLTNNFDKLFENIIKSLKPNGLFIATLPGSGNIFQLKNSMIETDISLYGGAFNRMNKTYSAETISLILKKHNYKIPIIEVDELSLEYSKFKILLNDLRNMSLTNIEHDRKNKFEKKKYFKELENYYRNNYFINDKFILSVKFIIISGWKQHDSQQIPLQPGKM